MKKLSCFVTRVVFGLAIVCTHLPAHTQTVKDTSTNWSAWMEKGKHQKTLGLVFMGVGAGLFTVCALIDSEIKPTYVNLPTAGQYITGILGFGATTSGAIAFFSGNAKVRRAKMELGKTSYYLLPGYQINGPSLSLKISLGK